MTAQEVINRNKEDLKKYRSTMDEDTIKLAEHFIKLLEERENNAK